MDIDVLEEFVVYAQKMSLASTASEIHMSVATLSRHINLLERELGQPLVERHSGGESTLTEAGKIVLEEAGEILKHHKRMTDRLQNTDNQDGMKITVAFGSSDHITADVVSLAMLALKNDGRRVETSFRQIPKQGELSLLDCDKADIAIVRDITRIDSARYKTVLYRKDTLAAVLSANRFPKDKHSVSLDELSLMTFANPICDSSDYTSFIMSLFEGHAHKPGLFITPDASLEEFQLRDFGDKFWVCCIQHMERCASSVPRAFFENNVIIPIESGKVFALFYAVYRADKSGTVVEEFAEQMGKLMTENRLGKDAEIAESC